MSINAGMTGTTKIARQAELAKFAVDLANLTKMVEDSRVEQGW